MLKFYNNFGCALHNIVYQNILNDLNVWSQGVAGETTHTPQRGKSVCVFLLVT